MLNAQDTTQHYTPIRARGMLSDILSRVDARDIARRYLAPKVTRPKYDQYFAQDIGLSRIETQASVAVYADGYKDFGGDGSSGSALGLIMLLERCDRAQAIERLREYAGELPARHNLAKPNVQHARARIEPPSSGWQRNARRIVAADERRLWSDEGRAALDYLHGRGLADATIQHFHYGYNADRQAITLPTFQGDDLWAVQFRYLAPDAPKRYVHLSGGKQAGWLYGVDDLLAGQKQALIVVEGQFKAAAVWQAAGDLVNVVTVGNATNRLPGRFNRLVNGAKRIVLIRDNDEAGQTNADKNTLGLPARRIVVTAPQHLGSVKAIDDYGLLGGDIRQFIADCLSLPTSDIVISDNGEKSKAGLSSAGLPSCDFMHPKTDIEATIAGCEVVTLGTLIDLLNSDTPDRALDFVLTKAVSQSTMKRRQARKNMHRSEMEDSVHKIAPSVYWSQKRANRIRRLFPQGNRDQALIPLARLTTELCADELTDDTLTALRSHPAMQALDKRQQKKVKEHYAVLRKVENLEKRLKTVPFNPPDEPIENLSALRGHVLRQILEYVETTKPAGYVGIDPVTGEKTPQLSGRVQAALIGLTRGALPALQNKWRIEQTAPAIKQHKHAPGETIKPNCLYFKVRDSAGLVQAPIYRNHPNLNEALDRAMQAGYDVFQMLCPVSRQHVLPLTAPAPREHTVKVAQGNTSNHLVSEKAQQNTTPIRARKPRRAPREQYAGLLMRNILYHLGKQVSADEPLDELAAELRRVISTPWIERSDPDNRPDVEDIPHSNIGTHKKGVPAANIHDDQKGEPDNSVSEKKPGNQSVTEKNGCRIDIAGQLATVNDLSEQLKKTRTA